MLGSAWFTPIQIRRDRGTGIRKVGWTWVAGVGLVIVPVLAIRYCLFLSEGVPCLVWMRLCCRPTTIGNGALGCTWFDTFTECSSCSKWFSLQLHDSCGFFWLLFHGFFPLFFAGNTGGIRVQLFSFSLEDLSIAVLCEYIHCL